MATYASNQLHSVPLAELHPDPTQPPEIPGPPGPRRIDRLRQRIGIIEPQPVYREKPVTSIEISTT